MMSRPVFRTARGFTLLEILTTVGIIAILLSTAVPAFRTAQSTSRAASCQASLRQILAAKERWAMDNNRGPTDTPLISQLVAPNYLKNGPTCPSGGTYTVGSLDRFPTCSIGGVPGDRTAHVLP